MVGAYFINLKINGLKLLKKWIKIAFSSNNKDYKKV